ncbi:MAG TPA: oligoendopeptidase F [Clostridiales bacterium]|nr:oligoendopeptidase F [Clostridiales bacterium]
MSETLRERAVMDPRFQWDLSTLYENDDAFESDLKTLDTLVDAAAAFRGKLNTAANIRAYMDAETQLERKLSDLFCYANLRRSEDTRAEAAQSMYMRIYGIYVQAVTRIAFAVPEILSLPEETLKAFATAPELESYAFSMDNLLRRKPHTLSEAEETLLARFGEVLEAPGEIADNLQDADMVFDAVKDGEGKEHEVTGSNYILLQTDPDRVLRENAFHSFYKGYREHNNTFAATYSANVKNAVAEAEVRHYSSSRNMYMSGENVPEEVYDNLISTVRKHLPTMYKYVEFRKERLGLSDIHYYDVYAPLVADSTKKYSYEEAQQMVLQAVAPLGEDYVSVVKGAYDARWIDVYPNKGKSGGAFSSGTYDSNPFILTNFTGTLDSVSTIAHEMGHSMHSYFSNRNQPPQYAQYTIFVAEVASTVNENLLITQLLQKTTDPAEKLSLLNQYLENFKGTVYRQTMFSEFERDAHAMAERGEALTPDALNQMYYKLVEDYFGAGLTMDEEIGLEWSRIPHFYRPFYVYKYATSYCAAMAISESILAGKPGAVEAYRRFLTLGGSKYPLEELQEAGVDLTSPAPLDAALRKFASVLDDAIATAALLGR